MTSNVASIVRHRLIICNPAHKVILLESGHLPRLVTEDQHTAEVDYINAAVGERFGLRTRVLQSLSHSDGIDGVVDRVHELEVLGDDALGLAAGEWRSFGCIGLSGDALDRQALQQWLQEREANLVDGREWTRSGWFTVARVWIELALRPNKLPVPTEIVQLRTWATSTVLLVHTASGDYYLKALPESGRDA